MWLVFWPIHIMVILFDMLCHNHNHECMHIVKISFHISNKFNICILYIVSISVSMTTGITMAAIWQAEPTKTLVLVFRLTTSGSPLHPVDATHCSASVDFLGKQSVLCYTTNTSGPFGPFWIFLACFVWSIYHCFIWLFIQFT